MTALQPKQELSLQGQMFRGSMWIIAMRWSDRLLGLVSTLILARLLTPADYGIVAIAGIIVGIVEVFSYTGQNSAIIRHPNPSREHYDSAWTVSLILGLGMGLIIWALAPLATAYFHEPRATLVVQILGVRTMLSGCQNVGVVNFGRELRFDKQFWFSSIPPFMAFVIGIPAAFILRNYWALLISLMAQYATGFVLSYAMSSYRPRLSISKIPEIWSFSFWTLIKNIGTHVNGVLDQLAIGGFAGSAAMGRYYVASDVATSPTEELVVPMVGVLFPVMARVQNDREKRRELYMAVLYWSALICTSTAIGVALVANEMVDLVLGAKWEDAKPLIPWLALAYGVLGLTSSVYTSLDTIGQPLLSARLQWLRLLVFATVVFPVAYHFKDIEMVAATRLFVTLAVAPTLFYALMKPFDLSVRDFAKVLWRPLLGGAVMALAVLSANAALPYTGIVRLFIDVLIGALTYGATLMLLWLAIGKPEGPERELSRYLGGKFWAFSH